MKNFSKGLLKVLIVALFTTLSLTFVACSEPGCAHKQTEILSGYAKTCDTDGLTEGKRCLDCGETLIEQEVITAGHTPEVVTGYAKTCTTDGLTDGSKCSDCQEVIEAQEVIPAGHTPEVVVGYAKTCTTDGLTDGSKCSDCQQVLENQQVIYASHERVEDKMVPATCGTTGLTTGYHCEDCKDVLTKQEIIPATGNHDASVQVDTLCGTCNTVVKATSGIRLTMQTNGEYQVTGFNEFSTKVTKIYLPKTYNGIPVTSIGNYAFSGCASVTEFVIPEGYTSIGCCAFLRCTGLKRLEMPSTITFVDDGVFEKCENIETIILSDNIKHMGEFNYNIPNTKTTYYTESNNIYYIGTKTNPYFYLAKVKDTSKTSYTVHADTKIIGDQSFGKCKSLSRLTVPEGVIEIGDNAFASLTNLYSVSLPSTLQKISVQAFSGCSKLNNVVFPDSLQIIEERAFYGCTALNNITIGSNLVDFSGLIDVVTNLQTTTTGDAIYLGDGTNNYLALAKIINTELTNFEVNANTKYILDSAFKDLTNIATVSLPNALETIGNGAFSGCTSLSTINFPQSLKTINANAFKDCSSLTSISIPDGIELIDSAFSGSGVKELRVDSLEQLLKCKLGNTGVDAYVNGILLENLVIPNTIKAIEKGAFRGIKSIKTVEIQDGVKSIGVMAFADCTGIESVVIPDSVEIMGKQMFYNCTSLQTLTIPYLNFRKDHTDDGFFGYFFNGYGRASGYTTYSEYKLSKLTITGGTILETYAFTFFYPLKELVLPDTLTKIDGYAFENTQLSTDKLNKFGNCWYIGSENNPYMVLYKADKDTNTNPNLEFTIHENTKFILDSVFKGVKLTTIVIPEGVIGIGNSAFENCTRLQTVCVPSSLQNLGDLVFAGCTALVPTIIEENISYLGNSVNPYVITYCYAGGTLSSTTLTMNSNTKFIHSNAFDGMGTYVTLVVPEGVLQIRSDAFRGGNYYGGTALTNISLPSSLTYIGTRAFYNNKKVTAIKLPKNLEEIGAWAFTDTKITTINIPEKVVWLYNICDQTLKSVVFENPTGWYVAANDFEALGTNGVVNYDLTKPNAAADALEIAIGYSDRWRRLKTPTDYVYVD